ncbi:MAG TPA: anthranilate phosphoribosyltransferase [Candidatus Nanoarchaeia archaeon]|nr:anthranilate phosphoribosyltransferase [Candidatus Nanoarchaeia archaeon]
MIQEAILKLADKKDLIGSEAAKSMEDIMEGKATNAQVAAFLIGLKLKGENTEEITACAKVMRDKSIKIEPDAKFLVDTCGTGGDNSGTFNISTAAAFVAAGAGADVAKHGNRSISSKCGSADVLSALGVNINLEPKKVEECIEKVGIGFLFAPRFHPAMKFAMEARKEIGIRTIFNILGPLTNPAGAKCQLIGVFDSELMHVMADVLKNLGSRHAIIVNGSGLDEITLTGETKVIELKSGVIESYSIKPEALGFETCSIADLKGGTPEENAKIIIDILSGLKGPKRDVVVLNSAAALLSCGLAKNYEGAIAMAARSIDSGSAMKKLNDLREFTKNASQNN